jgi:preprotein translocase SecE subunit
MGLYKPGQGYWTRVGTAIGLLLLLLSGVAWIVQQCNLVPIPVSSWTLGVSGADQIDAGTTAKILSEPKIGEQPAVVGTGNVVSVGSPAAGRQSVSIDQVTFTEGQSTLASGKTIVFGNNASAIPAKLVSTSAVRAFELMWLQGAAAAVVFLCGAGLIYWVVGVRARSVDFLIATDAEMKKVNWSSRKTIIDSTWMVVGASVLISALIYVIDIVFQWFFVLIKVLDR